ncbi:MULTISPECIES: FtsB family cell division protein [Commensalibacter]|uniref:FtsB family cell division protein n=1 Tax=Commensalibacter TaxID=1079922 RepID=UPI0012D86269|nr:MULTISPECIES: septum formation initiator family protein [Commensalibacter]MBH9972830.1 septum formation initiator family protein [Commensalibacter melissae]MBI0016639.1 septum formation initiator family protein [Commensalibacter sp. B14384M2]MBI0018386.1 septum formation initiator family protein [Commensalibacter sp. W8133]MBI0049824.1 septum formation initiator family protein [Commensalibacter sp. B14384M3]MBI0179871.1 septum formation initiator family protein [Commensalibacter sp. W8163]
MHIIHAIKRFVKATIPPLFFLLLTAYFVKNTFDGDHGLKSYHIQQEQMIRAQQSQQDAISEQAAWERRVKGLKENALDADLLDERTRVMLSYSNQEEIVIPYRTNEHLY